MRPRFLGEPGSRAVMSYDEFNYKLSVKGNHVRCYVNGHPWRSWYNLPLVHRVAWWWVCRSPRDAVGGGAWRRELDSPTTLAYSAYDMEGLLSTNKEGNMETPGSPEQPAPGTPPSPPADPPSPPDEGDEGGGESAD